MPRAQTEKLRTSKDPNESGRQFRRRANTDGESHAWDRERLCRACAWTYEVSLLRRTLFDDNPEIDSLMKGKHGYFLSYLSTITQEYVLSQLAKLHDPERRGHNVNLSIDYVNDSGAWDQETAARLRNLRDQLNDFAGHLRVARNKLLSHNDLAASLADEPLGVFPENADREYFAALQEFVNVVHDKVVGGPWPFPEHVRTDVHVFLRALAKSQRVTDASDNASDT